MNKIFFNEEAREKLKAGVDIAYKAVAGTLGASGRNAVYRSFYSRNPIGSNDGISILKEIDLEDEATQMGVDMVKQSSSRTNDDAGDGTTSTVILSKHMVDRGLELIKDKKVNPMILRKQINEAVKKLVAKIKEKAKKIETDEDIFNVANISVENPEIAKIVVEAVKRAGENGTVLVEESNDMDIKKEEIDGMKFEKGYITPYMVTNPATMECVMEDTPVLVTDKTLNMNTDLFPLIEALNTQGVKKLLIICGDMQGEVLSSIIANKYKGLFNCVVVQKPDDDVLEDIACLVGAENMTTAKNAGYFNATHLEKLGHVKKVIITKDSTVLIGGKGKVDERVESIKLEMKDASGYKKEILKERLAKLVGGVVIIKVGAPTEAEMKYLRMKIDDSVASTRAAIEDGIIIGGGKTLYELSSAKPENHGEDVVFYACQQPIKQIIENAGYEPEEELAKLKDGQAWNALTCSITDDPMKDGLVDPAKVERCCLENSASFAGLFLSCFCLIADEKKNSEIS